MEEDRLASSWPQSALAWFLTRGQKVSSRAPPGRPFPPRLNSNGPAAVHACATPPSGEEPTSLHPTIPRHLRLSFGWAKWGWGCRMVFWEMQFACPAGATAQRRPDSALQEALRAVRWAVRCCPHVAAGGYCTRPGRLRLPGLGKLVSTWEPLGISTEEGNPRSTKMGWGKKLRWRN